MKHVKGRTPSLVAQNVVPILISADFLEMASLIGMCTSFIAEHLPEMSSVPLDMSNISSKSMKKIAGMVSLKSLDEFKDPRDYLSSKLFMHKLDALMAEDGNQLVRCQHCNVILAEKNLEWSRCPNADSVTLQIDHQGRETAYHSPDPNWSTKDFIQFLKQSGVSWRRIFWKVWARTIEDVCQESHQRFTASDVNNCVYHPRKPMFTFGSNRGHYPCCQTPAVRFTTMDFASGCLHRMYEPTKLEGTQEW